MLDVNTKSISLADLGIENATVRYQLSSSELHKITLEKGQGKESSLGANCSEHRRVYWTFAHGSFYCQR